jgi:hypothetical protein
MKNYINSEARKGAEKGFVQCSREEFEGILVANLPVISKYSSFGIFGTADAAYYINEFLFRYGYEDVVYFSTNPQFDEIEGRLLLKIDSDSVLSRDLIFTSSLSDSDAQEKIILGTGFSGELVKLPDLKHISVTMMQDYSSNDEINQLKDKHKGQPAFVIGNGASLLETDPRRLGGDVVTFAGNGIVRLENFSPDYYFSLDYSALVHWSDEIFRLSSSRFFPSRLWQWINENESFRQKNNLFYPACYERRDDLSIDDWYKHGFETGHTIISPMLQMAAWMGCSTVYLIGVDLSHDKKGDYFSANYHASSFRGYKKEQLQAFKTKLPRGINRSINACKKKGVEVINLSPFKSLPGVKNLCFESVIHGFSHDV